MSEAKHSVELSYERFSSPADLPEDEQALLNDALEAAQHAYAPHSGFNVGCAVLLEGGEVLTGNNQENLAYPSGLCAERVALYHVGSLGKASKIRKIAVRAFSDQLKVDQPVTPCGACRQVMWEYEQLAEREVIVLMQGNEGPVLKVKGVSRNLLPFAFDFKL